MKSPNTRFLAFCSLSACALGLSGCHKAADEAGPTPTAVVVIQKAVEHPLEDMLTAYGVVEFAPAHTQALTAQVEMQLAERFVLPGTPVKRGQPLVRLVPSAASRLEVDKAERDAQNAGAELQRATRLQKAGLMTESDLRTARAAAATAEALRNSLRARIGSNGLTLKATRDGIVDAFTAQPGEVIPAGTLILRIADPAAIFVRVGLEPNEATLVKHGQAATVSALTPEAAAMDAHIVEVDGRVDPQTRLAAAIAEPAKGSALIPGSAMRAKIVISVHEHAITVPRSAVLYAEGEPFVFIANSGKAQRRAVKTGLTDDTQIEILQGVKAGEPVVTGGNYELEDGMKITTQAAAAPDAKTGES